MAATTTSAGFAFARAFFGIGRSSGSRVTVRSVFPAKMPVTIWNVLYAYGGGSAGEFHPSSLFSGVHRSGTDTFIS